MKRRTPRLNGGTDVLHNTNSDPESRRLAAEILDRMEKDPQFRERVLTNRRGSRVRKNVLHNTQNSGDPRPTRETYGPLEAAFDHLNAGLFEGRLPSCEIITTNRKRSAGFFSPDRFARVIDSRRSHVIALNLTRILAGDTKGVISTLAHEMVHAEQQCFGKPGRGRYHNKEWGRLMDRIGLCPSDTGQPGGRRTGQRMSHYEIPGGPFDHAFAALLRTGFSLDWGEIPVANGDTKTGRVKYVCANCGMALLGARKHEGKPACLACDRALDMVDA